MKKFILKVMFFSMYCFLLCFVSYSIDPYNIFHWNNIRNNGVAPNRNYVKTKYIINNPEKFDGFLFGSSRVGAIHVEKIADVGIYNMTYPCGTPREHLETLRTFLDNGVKIDVVYLGVDSYSYTENAEEHYKQPLTAPYQVLTDISDRLYMYMDPSLWIKSLSTIMKRDSIDGFDFFYDYGWCYEYAREATMNRENAYAVIGSSFLLEEALDDIKEMKTLCDENKIELVVFTNPMYEITYEASIELEYLDFLKQLSFITDYYNFSGLNDITMDPNNYIDPSHYNAEVGDCMIDVMINNKVNDLYRQGFGYYVTGENVNVLLDILKEEQIMYADDEKMSRQFMNKEKS